MSETLDQQDPVFLQNASPLRTAMKWGAIIFGMYALVSTLLSLLRSTSIAMGLFQMLLFFILTCVGYWMACKEQRDKLQGGYITFGKAFATGMLTTVFLSLVAGAILYISMSLASGSLDDVLLKMEEALDEQNIPDQQKEDTMNIYRKIMNPGTISMLGIMMLLFGGLIPSLIASAITKKDQPQTGF